MTCYDSGYTFWGRTLTNMTGLLSAKKVCEAQHGLTLLQGTKFLGSLMSGCVGMLAAPADATRSACCSLCTLAALPAYTSHSGFKPVQRHTAHDEGLMHFCNMSGIMSSAIMGTLPVSNKCEACSALCAAVCAVILAATGPGAASIKLHDAVQSTDQPCTDCSQVPSPV